MADPVSATLTPEEAAYNREWARSRLDRLKASKRAPAKRDYRPAKRSALERFTSLPTAREWSAANQRSDEMLTGQPVGGKAAGVMEQRLSRYRDLRQARRVRDSGGTLNPAQAVIDAEASAVARQAYARVWDVAQEAIEDLSIGFFGLMSVVTVVPLLATYFVRLIGGHAMNGGRTITYRGVTVPLVPKYDWVTGPMHTMKLLLVVMITAIIGLLAFGVAHFIYSTVTGLCGGLGIVLNALKPGLCAVVK